MGLGGNPQIVQSVTICISGSEQVLEYNPMSGYYEGVITAPTRSSYTNEGGYYSAVICAQDDTSNLILVDDNDTKFGKILRLTVREKVKPSVAITSCKTGSDSNGSAASLTLELRDDDSGICLDSLVFTVDDASFGYLDAGMQLVPVMGGYDVVYTLPKPLIGALHSVTVFVADNDGNLSDMVHTSWRTKAGGCFRAYLEQPLYTGESGHMVYSAVLAEQFSVVYIDGEAIEGGG